MNNSTVKFKVIERVVLKKKNRDSGATTTKKLKERVLSSVDSPVLGAPRSFQSNRTPISLHKLNNRSDPALSTKSISQKLLPRTPDIENSPYNYDHKEHNDYNSKPYKSNFNPNIKGKNYAADRSLPSKHTKSHLAPYNKNIHNLTSKNSEHSSISSDNDISFTHEKPTRKISEKSNSLSTQNSIPSNSIKSASKRYINDFSSEDNSDSSLNISKSRSVPATPNYKKSSSTLSLNNAGHVRKNSNPPLSHDSDQSPKKYNLSHDSDNSTKSYKSSRRIDSSIKKDKLSQHSNSSINNNKLPAPNSPQLNQKHRTTAPNSPQINQNHRNTVPNSPSPSPLSNASDFDLAQCLENDLNSFSLDSNKTLHIPGQFAIPVSSASLILNSSTKYVNYFNFDSHVPNNVLEYWFKEMSSIKLKYPANDCFEQFSILVPEECLTNPLSTDEYNPLTDLISTVSVIAHMINEDSSLKNKILDPSEGILRQLEKHKNKKNGPGFLSAVTSFNKMLCGANLNFKQYKNVEIPYEISNHIFNQIYNRCVGEHVDKLRNYRAFSNNVYGEVNPILVNEFIKKCKISHNDIFVDLGCGIGNVVIQVAIQTGCASYGVEVMDTPASLAQLQVNEYNLRMKSYNLKRGIAHITHGDFLEDQFAINILKSATVVLVNNHAFDSTLNQRLMQMFLDLKDGTKIISLKSFVPLDFKINSRNAGSLESILKPKRFIYNSDSVSWTGNSGNYFIQTIDRSDVKKFFENFS
ncbi:Histone-lysine N-methyltransferase, H3 lysine-79 specific [Smittium culicis]|uniref:Histone-lysine N-methyltransferase, H3 lysine-79 specific n=1 Tax=Smittium culicis TaxID=133412 RepID=A0A1R1Y0D5_9FUNG|nr:Histone-lysine N-methyltransferase, H3 lysine-79 specific [Smittium culicis]